MGALYPMKAEEFTYDEIHGGDRGMAKPWIIRFRWNLIQSLIMSQRHSDILCLPIAKISVS